MDRHGIRIKEAKAEMLGKSGVVSVWEKDAHKLEQVSSGGEYGSTRTTG